MRLTLTSAVGVCLLIGTPVARADVVVTIDVKPASASNRIDPDARSTVRVEIPSGPGFDAADVDVRSLTFGATGDEPSLASCYSWSSRRGPSNLLCHFNLPDTGLRWGHTRAVLKGSLRDGTRFRGETFVGVYSRRLAMVRESRHGRLDAESRSLSISRGN